ncbi:hypothetical protein ACGFXC_10330 [Streptomyces sp. NPDC048507]|uniref:hypothetical protein n=1 Tax=Streptomyces sp. NPDC048507 TaxID=3365560 RepID=UPI003717C68E
MAQQTIAPQAGAFPLPRTGADFTVDHAQTYVDSAVDSPLWLKLADREAQRIRHARPGADYPAYADLQDVYGVSRTTISKTVAELRRRGLIQRASGFRNEGHVVAGGGAGAPAGRLRRLAHLARTGEGQLWPEPGDGGTCPVCGGGRRGENHPVWGHACSSCIRTGAVITRLN